MSLKDQNAMSVDDGKKGIEKEKEKDSHSLLYVSSVKLLDVYSGAKSLNFFMF